ncbi:MAG: hypothetical protein ACYDHP_00670 [Ferrimicrobium sp.]
MMVEKFNTSESFERDFGIPLEEWAKAFEDMKATHQEIPDASYALAYCRQAYPRVLKAFPTGDDLTSRSRRFDRMRAMIQHMELVNQDRQLEAIKPIHETNEARKETIVQTTTPEPVIRRKPKVGSVLPTKDPLQWALVRQWRIGTQHKAVRTVFHGTYDEAVDKCEELYTNASAPPVNKPAAKQKVTAKVPILISEPDPVELSISAQSAPVEHPVSSRNALPIETRISIMRFLSVMSSDAMTLEMRGLIFGEVANAICGIPFDLEQFMPYVIREVGWTGKSS